MVDAAWQVFGLALLEGRVARLLRGWDLSLQLRRGVGHFGRISLHGIDRVELVLELLRVDRASLSRIGLLLSDDLGDSLLGIGDVPVVPID